MKNEQDHADVITYPPIIYLIAFAISWLLNYFFPLIVPLPRIVSAITGILFIIIAAVIAFAASKQLEKAKTNIVPYKPTTAIVSTGIYAFSRNPIYLALTSLFLGANFLINNLWGLFLLIPLVLFVQVGIIMREERYLERKFGDEYLRYKARVRRWL